MDKVFAYIEWEKIKDSGIFDSFDDFYKVFQDKPYGQCFKKYTNYPWCKENFFFGSYKDLLEFYKNSMEIPFYLKKYIGQRFGELTILSFVVRGQRGKKKVYANCICDCGKECCKEFKKIKENHVKTCGNHRTTNDLSLKAVYSEIVEKYWDYEKNIELPENISANSKSAYWWKDETGSFNLSPKDLVRKATSTSFHEQCILWYCQKIFNNVESRFKLRTNNSCYELDIYMPNKKIAIEYDGVFWHKDKLQSDLDKTEQVNHEGIFLLRIREKGLEEISGDLCKTIFCEPTDEKFYITINQVINILCQYIKQYGIKLANDEKRKLFEFKLDCETFIGDKVNILNNYRNPILGNNISQTCLIKFWDYERNDVLPQQVYIEDDVKMWFKCPYGLSKQISVKYLSDSRKIKCKDSHDCSNCKSFYCPLDTFCDLKYTYYSKTLCPLIRRYYYYRVFVLTEKDKHSIEYTGDKSDYIGCKAIDKKDDFFTLINIYKFHKKELHINQPLLNRCLSVFSDVSLDRSMFISDKEFKDFFELCKPWITSINYASFDRNESDRKLLLSLIDSNKIDNLNWENAKQEVSAELYQKIKGILEKRFISLDTKNKNLSEIKKLIKSFNPVCTNVCVEDFDIDEEHRQFFLNYIKKHHILRKMSPVDFCNASSSLLVRLPKYSDFCLYDEYGKKWLEKFQEMYGEKLDSKNIKLSLDNFTSFLELRCRQKKDLKTFAIIVNCKEDKCLPEIKSLTVKLKKDKKRQKVKVISSEEWQTVFNVFFKTEQKYKDCPLEIIGIEGEIKIFNR